MWTCPKCGKKIDGSFEVCWFCGTSREGVEDPNFVWADDAPPKEFAFDDGVPWGDQPPSDRPEPLSDLVECYLALTSVEAKFVADELTEQGIPAVADTEDMRSELGLLAEGPRVWVRLEDLPRAREWIAEYERQHKANHPYGE